MLKHLKAGVWDDGGVVSATGAVLQVRAAELWVGAAPASEVLLRITQDQLSVSGGASAIGPAYTVAGTAALTTTPNGLQALTLDAAEVRIALDSSFPAGAGQSTMILGARFRAGNTARTAGFVMGNNVAGAARGIARRGSEFFNHVWGPGDAALGWYLPQSQWGVFVHVVRAGNLWELWWSGADGTFMLASGTQVFATDPIRAVIGGVLAGTGIYTPMDFWYAEIISGALSAAEIASEAEAIYAEACSTQVVEPLSFPATDFVFTTTTERVDFRTRSFGGVGPVRLAEQANTSGAPFASGVLSAAMLAEDGAITIRVADASGDSADGVVSVQNLIPRPEVVGTPSITIAAGAVQEFSITSWVTPNDPEDVLTVSETAPPTGGTVALSGDIVVYTAPAEAGAESLSLRVTDSGGGYVEFTVAVTVEVASVLAVGDVHTFDGRQYVAYEAAGPMTLDLTDANGTRSATVDQALLASGPQQAFAGAVSGGDEVGDTITAAWPVFEFEGTPDITGAWTGGAEDDLALTRAGGETGLSFDGTASDGVNSTPFSIPANDTAALTIPMARIDNQGAAYLTKANVGADSNRLFLVADVVFDALPVSRSTLWATNSAVEASQFRVRLESNGQVSFSAASSSGGAGFFQSTAITAGQRFRCLVTITDTGAGACELKAVFSVAAGAFVTRGPAAFTQIGSYAFSGASNRLLHNSNGSIITDIFDGKVTRLEAWHGRGDIDPYSAVTQGLFWDASGNPKNAEVAWAALGQSAVLLTGPAANPNGLINLGSAGNFDLRSGSFIDG